MIAKLKESNNIDKNIDDDKLGPELFVLVEELKDQSEVLINEIEENEKEAKSYWINKKPNFNIFIHEWKEKLKNLIFFI